MKKKNIVPLLLVSGLLISCSKQNANANSNDEYKNPLNDYEEIIVKKSILENFLNISSIQTTNKISKDDEKLYGEGRTIGYTKEETTSSVTTAIYSNKIIVSDTIYSSSVTSSGIVVKNSYELKSMTAALANPETLVKEGGLTTTYGLYTKNFYKASSGKEFGVTYQLVNGNFANEDNLDYKWNNYLLNSFDSISSTSYDYFRDDQGNVEALYSTSNKVVETNPVFRYDDSKSVTKFNTSISSLILDNVDDGYQLKSLSNSSDSDYLSDYFGNALMDGNVYHSETNSTYFYGQTVFPGVPFEATEYWNLDSATPILETINGDNVTETTFTNITRDYQQTYGTDSFAFELTYTPTKESYTYSLTNKEGKQHFDPSSFNISSTAGITINSENKTFSFDQLNTSYRLLVIIDAKFTTTQVSISLA